METLLEVQNLVKFYGNKTSLTKAVNENLQQLWGPAALEKQHF